MEPQRGGEREGPRRLTAVMNHDPTSFGPGRSRSEALSEGERYLRSAGIPGARLEVELLLAHFLGVERVGLQAHLDDRVSGRVAKRFLKGLEERGRGRPIAHLLGGQEFYELYFEVNEDVLIPRPETELLVDWGLELARGREGSTNRIADLGTCCGCIAITLAAHLAHAKVDAVDISLAALAVARRNAERHRVGSRIRFLGGDLLAPLEGSYALILANPPYVEPGDPRLDPRVEAFEPGVALFDVHDRDGLGFYRRLAREALGRLEGSGSLLVEMPDAQASAIVRIFESAGNVRSEVRRDLAGIERVARFWHPLETGPETGPGSARNK